MRIAIVATLMSFHASFNLSNIRLLRTLGYEIDVIGNRIKGSYSQTKVDVFSKYCESIGVNLHYVDIPRSPIQLFKIIKSYYRLKDILIKNKVKFVHSHTPVGGLIGRLASRRLKLINIYTAHGFHFYDGAPLINWILYLPVEWLMSRYTDAIVTINAEDYRIANKLQSKKVYNLPGVGVDFNAVKKKSDLVDLIENPVSQVKLLSVGELNRNKNHLFVIESISSMSSDIMYSIFGSGKLEAKYKKLINERSIHKIVELEGYRDNIKSLYSLFDVFIMPSLREGLPIALLEAMSAGLPVLASNVRGIKELVVEGKGGFLYEPNNVVQFLDKLQILINNPSMRYQMGQYNRIKAKQYDVNIVTEKMTKIYQEILN